MKIESPLSTKMNPSLFIGEPKNSQLPELRSLWKEAFGDSDAFLDIFEATAFSSKHCRCITLEDKVVAALYWFDCEFQGKPIAYIYAVATASRYRGQGLCHALMKDTHSHLTALGYAGALLVPGNPTLFDFYQKMGYQTCTYMDEIHYDDTMLHIREHTSIHLRPIDRAEYAKLRRNYLPECAVIQEQENLDFLQTQAEFYAGKDFVLACQKQEHVLHGIELLGDTSSIPDILIALECSKGTFRIPGKEKPFGMFYNFTEHLPHPNYFGLAFD